MMPDKILLNILCAVVIVTVLTVSVCAGEPLSAEIETLSGEEIKTLISGNTFIGTTSTQVHFEKTFNADGSYSLVKVDGPSREGSWWVENNMYCQKRYELSECYYFEPTQSGFNVLDGGGAIHSTLTNRE